MEFHEKLQALRRQKGLTQEELAAELFVSRTAVSKWESGRGYPSIDSLKALANFYRVTVDELLSGQEILTLAEEDRDRKTRQLQCLFFSLLDIGAVAFLFLPLFGQQETGMIRAVALPALKQASAYLLTAYWAAVGSLILWGILTLTLHRKIGEKRTVTVSALLNIVAVLLFILSSRPYAAALAFLFLVIKAFFLIRNR